MGEEEKEGRAEAPKPPAEVPVAESQPAAKEPSGAGKAEEPPAEQPGTSAQPGAAGADGERTQGEAAPPIEEMIPPDIHRVSIPFVGRLPIRTVAILTCLAALAFTVVLIVGLTLWTPSPPEVPYAGEPAAAAPAAAPAVLAVDVSALSYDDLMDRGERSLGEDDAASAAHYWRAAATREDAGLPKVLLARHKLSDALSRLGQYEEGLRLCEALRSVSRPGDELWKNALISSITVLGRQGRWKDFFQQVHLLRANSARYADEDVLNRWLAYWQAMAKVRLYLERSKQAATLYGMKPPAFGEAPCACRPLLAEQIIPTSGKYGDGTLKADYARGELQLVSEGAPLGKVLSEVARAAGLSVTYDGPTDYPISASLKTISPEHALELVLGSVGLSAAGTGGRVVVRKMDPLPKSKADALKDALWSLQEFLILYPESAHVAEAYYALGHAYMMEGQTKMALDQFEILCREFPRSAWSVYGHYVAGRARCELQDWERGERELLAVVDQAPAHVLTQSAFLWAAQCQVELRKYQEAVACFRRALAKEPQDPLTPSILYKIAFCLEKSGASPLEVEERYTELRTRYPGTDYAREADYRLARMRLESGDYGKAVERYEFYLSSWPLEAKPSRQACSDLVVAYVRAGEHVRAVLLGEVMCASFGGEAEYWAALPTLLEAYGLGGLQGLGLDLADRLLAATQDPAQRAFLNTEKARLLVDLQKYEEAGALISQLRSELTDPDLLAELKLVEARALLAQREAERGLELCREVALKCRSEQTRAKALTLMGQHYEGTKDFEKAALAYAGKCPLQVGGSSP